MRQPGILPGFHRQALRIGPSVQPARSVAVNLRYWTELATEENTLLALEPISRMVPTTITRMTASITAYSAMSWPNLRATNL